MTVPASGAQEWEALNAAIEERAGAIPCRTTGDAEAWFEPSTYAMAADACLGCPVFVQCGEYATAAGEQWGVWAGVVRHRRARSRARAS